MATEANKPSKIENDKQAAARASDLSKEDAKFSFKQTYHTGSDYGSTYMTEDMFVKPYRLQEEESASYLVGDKCEFM
jgi:hypothetical protein